MARQSNAKIKTRGGAAGIFFAVMLIASLFIPQAAALGVGAFTMEVLVDDVPLEEHPARGLAYIEALRDREYSVRLRNNTGRRIAVALAVDGLNSIDAKTTSAKMAESPFMSCSSFAGSHSMTSSGESASSVPRTNPAPLRARLRKRSPPGF